MAPSERKDGEMAPAIPTYDEAISTRPHSARLFQGPTQISADAERQGFLSGIAPGTTQQQWHGCRRYQRVEDAEEDRRSEDSVDFLSAEEHGHEAHDLRQDMEQMEEMDPSGSSSNTARLRQMLPQWSKRITVFRESLSAFSLPQVRLPGSSLTPYILDGIKSHWSLIIRIFILTFVLVVGYGVVITRVVTWKVVPPGSQFVPEAVRGFVQASVDAENIKKYLFEVTYDDHVAGTKGDYFLAEWVHDRFNEAGLEDVHYDDYEVYLNYPKIDGRRVAIVSPSELTWEAKLEEEMIPGMENQHQVPAFHGHSKSGNVTGPLVYANYGAKEDFDWLRSQGISLEGAIALVKYQGSQGDRAQKVKAAELAGAVGCLIYSDPIDDGFIRGETYPDGPWRPSDSLERGSVALSSWTVGDVLTPGFASLPDADRINISDAKGLVKIPSLPLAWRDAQILLQSLIQTGIPVPSNWIGGVPEISQWWTGNTSTSPIVNLMNLQDENTRQPIRNVIGRISGIEDPHKIIYVGNHRDAWCFGATDPGSGTAAFLEVIRIFGDLVDHGWRPRRTIVFASWDAEEYNLIGSTEHVENLIDDIRTNAVAYLNVDVAVAGQNFRANGNPVFSNVLEHVLARVDDPSSTSNGTTTLLDTWNATNSRLEGLGAGSDYVAFQSLAGCASLDFGFEGPPGLTYGPYHSCYENFEWMDKFGDPGFKMHAALAQVWGLLLLELADEPLLPLDLVTYSKEVARYVNDLAQETKDTPLDLTKLQEAADVFLQSAPEFTAFEQSWITEVTSRNMIESRELTALRQSHNARASNFDTHLLDLGDGKTGRKGGVPGREQFKHVIFGPNLWSGYEEEVFPAIRDAVGEKAAEGGRVGVQKRQEGGQDEAQGSGWEGAQDMVEIVAEVLRHAAWKLVH